MEFLSAHQSQGPFMADLTVLVSRPSRRKIDPEQKLTALQSGRSTLALSGAPDARRSVCFMVHAPAPAHCQAIR